MLMQYICALPSISNPPADKLPAEPAVALKHSIVNIS